MTSSHVPALDGLRGVAVIAVVVYHLRPHGLSGGFLGVDVFFVLSGYLISSLLIAEWESSGSIRLREFVKRRARRLVPALLLLLMGISVYAWVWAEEYELSRLRDHGLWTLSWLANWGYSTDGTTYSDVVIGASPLRHTWSLAIEEQFYLVFPLVVVALAWLSLHRRWRGGVRRALGVACLVGIGASSAAMFIVAQLERDIDRAYFGSDTRVFSLLMGVVLATLPGFSLGDDVHDVARGRWVTRVGMVSLVVLGALFFAAGERDLWMYPAGFLLAAMASAGIIAIARDGGVVARWLSLSPLVAVGKVSYSLYLWHWPIIVLVTPERIGQSGWILDLLRLTAIVVLAISSFLFVEGPIRAGLLGRRFGRGAVAIFLASIFVTGSAVWLSTSVDGPVSHDDSVLPETPSSLAVDSDPISVLVFGDSVAHTLAGASVFEFPRFDPWQPSDSPFDARRISLHVLTRPACSFMPGAIVVDSPQGEVVADFSMYCGDWRSNLTATLAATDIDVVVALLSNESSDRRIGATRLNVGTAEWLTSFDSLLDEIHGAVRAAGARLVLLTPVPRVGGAVPAVDADGWREAEVGDALARWAQDLGDVEVLDLAGTVCPRRDCRQPRDDFEPAWRYDGWHFSAEGSRWFANWITPRLESFVK